jgi:hypothetical protein
MLNRAAALSEGDVDDTGGSGAVRGLSIVDRDMVGMTLEVREALSSSDAIGAAGGPDESPIVPPHF